jgi:hypothetical protein
MLATLSRVVTRRHVSLPVSLLQPCAGMQLLQGASQNTPTAPNQGGMLAHKKGKQAGNALQPYTNPCTGKEHLHLQPAAIRLLRVSSSESPPTIHTTTCVFSSPLQETRSLDRHTAQRIEQQQQSSNKHTQTATVNRARRRAKPQVALVGCATLHTASKTYTQCAYTAHPIMMRCTCRRWCLQNKKAAHHTTFLLA